MGGTIRLLGHIFNLRDNLKIYLFPFPFPISQHAIDICWLSVDSYPFLNAYSSLFLSDALDDVVCQIFVTDGVCVNVNWW